MRKSQSKMRDSLLFYNELIFSGQELFYAQRPTASGQVVPETIGDKYEDAVTQIQNVQLVPKPEYGRSDDPSYTAGTVYDQEPKSGTLPANSRVVVWIQEEYYEMPNVSTLLFEDAMTKLKSHGITVENDIKINPIWREETGEDKIVLEQVPATGSKVYKGDPVSITVRKKTVPVPGVADKTVFIAVSKLKEKGFTVDFQKERPMSSTPGEFKRYAHVLAPRGTHYIKVLRQSPLQNQQHPLDKPVILTLPRTAKWENLFASGEEQALKALDPAAFTDLKALFPN